MIYLDLDRCVANHPFTHTGIGATVGDDAQFAGTVGSWLLPEST